MTTLATHLIDRSEAPLNTMLGTIDFTHTPEDADVIRACRAASRDHAERDPLATPVPDVAHVWSDTGVEYESRRLSDRAKDRLADMRWRREDRASEYGRRFYPSPALPWRACRVVGCMGVDAEYGADEKYTIIVRYASSGALVCYGVRDDGTLSVYWN
jgi:hypothetical protein